MRVTIEKPNGEKLTISGTPEEVARLLKAREEQPAPTIPAPVYIPYVRPTPWRWGDGAPVEPYLTWTAGSTFVDNDANLTASTLTLTEVS